MAKVVKFPGGYNAKKVMTFADLVNLNPELFPSGLSFFIMNQSTWWTTVTVSMYSNSASTGNVISNNNPWIHNGTTSYTEFKTDNAVLSSQAMMVDINLSMDSAGGTELGDYLSTGVLVEFGTAANLSSSTSIISCPNASPLAPYASDTTLTKSKYILKTGCGQGDASFINGVVEYGLKFWCDAVNTTGLTKLLVCRITDA